MATRSQKVKVGLFLVICGFVIVAGLILVSGFKHEERLPYWVEFDESVLGLTEGGTVEYKGVSVGIVENIYVTDEGKAHVDMRISTDKVRLHKGVTAQLVQYSFVTGIMVVSLAGGGSDQPELPAGSQIPTEPSLLESVSSQMQVILDDFGEVIDLVKTGLSGMDEGVLASIVDRVDQLIAKAHELLDNTDGHLATVKDEIQDTNAEIKELVDSAKDLVKNVNTTVSSVRAKVEEIQIGATENNINAVLEEVKKLTEELQTTVQAIDTLTKSAAHEVDNIEFTVRQTMQDASETLDAIRRLTESVGEDPAMLIRGRGTPKGDR